MVDAGWQRHCKTCRLLLELDNQGTVFLFVCFWRSVKAGGRVRSFMRGVEPSLRTRGMVVSRTWYLVVFMW